MAALLLVAVGTLAPGSRLSALAASEVTLPAAKAAAAAAAAAAAEYSLDTTCTDSRIYFDCIHMASRKASGADAFKGTPLGRLVFRLSGADLLPKHTSNVRMLCTGERTGCAYSYSWCTLERGPAKLKSHIVVLKGKGRNAYGKSNELISDEIALRGCARALQGGGAYYGVEVPQGDPDFNTVLAVPVRGAGKGTSRLAILTGIAYTSPSTRRMILQDHAVIGVLERPSRSASLPEGQPNDAQDVVVSQLVDALVHSKNLIKISSCGEMFASGQTSAVSCRFVPSPVAR